MHFEVLQDYSEVLRHSTIATSVLGVKKPVTIDLQVNISLLRHEATHQTHKYSMEMQEKLLKMLGTSTYSQLYKTIIDISVNPSMIHIFLSLEHERNMSHRHCTLLVSLTRFQTRSVDQDWSINYLSVTRNYIFEQERLRETTISFRTTQDTFPDTDTQLLRLHIIVLYEYCSQTHFYLRSDSLLTFQDYNQYTKTVLKSQDSIYCRKSAFNWSKCVYILYYLLVKHFILLFYLGAKCCTKQIENRTTIFH